MLFNRDSLQHQSIVMNYITQDKTNFSPTKHLYNFAGGVGLLPPKVIKESQKAISEVPNTGISALVIDHRSQLCRDIIDEAETNIRTLLNIPKNYQILFLQGGGSLQFAMIPMNCCPNKARSQARQCVSNRSSGIMSRAKM